MLAVLQHAVILLMPSVSALITPLGLAQMQMWVCVFVRVCIKSAKEEWVKEYHSLTKPDPLYCLHTCKSFIARVHRCVLLLCFPTSCHVCNTCTESRHMKSIWTLLMFRKIFINIASKQIPFPAYALTLKKTMRSFQTMQAHYMGTPAAVRIWLPWKAWETLHRKRQRQAEWD